MASGQKKKTKPKKKPAKKGRPTRYKAEYAEQAARLCKLGLTDVQMSEYFEVSEVTFNAWKKKHPAFLKSLKENKILADGMVAETLLNKALGNITITEDKMNNMGDIAECKRQIAPCTTSIIFWLKNRQPELWRDKQESETATPDLASALMQLADSLPS